MAKGRSLHVGLNTVNLDGIQVPPLRGCRNDAVEMQKIVGEKFSTRILLDKAATFDAVVGEIEQASQQLVDGDIFIFTFAGHGTRHGTKDPDEPDYKDENIVLFDKIVVDNVFRRSLWPLFKKGVRIFAVSDCCHAEGTFTVPPDGEVNANVVAHASVSVGSTTVVGTQPATNKKGALRDPQLRELEFGLNEVHFNKLADFYDKVRANLPQEAPPINADLLMLSACKSSQKAKDGDPNGVFTAALLEVMKEGLPANYKELRKAIALKVAEQSQDQNPVLTLFPGSDEEFPKQLPFSI